MGRVHERKHTDSAGTLIARITELEDGFLLVEIQRDVPERKIISLGVWGPPPYQTLVDAQRAADRGVSLHGHACSAFCQKWSIREGRQP
jgi:hypothetical protein